MIIQALHKTAIRERIIILSPFILLALHYALLHIGIKSICLWRLITGHECPGCGITHAVAAVLKGNFAEALRYNRGIVIVFPLLCYEWIKYTYAHIRRSAAKNKNDLRAL